MSTNAWEHKSAERDKIEQLCEMSEEYCNPKQNVTVLRYKFNNGAQQSDGNIAQYVTKLRRLAKDCSYGHLTVEMIRDQMVCVGQVMHEFPENFCRLKP